MSFKVGDRLGGRFVLLERVGHGGMGGVYRAADEQTGRTVAVKVLESPEREAASRFRREANVLASLHHDAIVQSFAHQAEGAAPWIAMEWLAGEDLGVRLRREGMDVSAALAMVRRAADAVGAAHAVGVVHRDLKPGNLFLVDGDPRKVKLIDFGIARLRTGVSDLTAGATQAGAFLGTVGYLAPEQARGEPTVGPASDVFSLGVVLYHCLTGHRPFHGANPTAVLAKILFEDPPPAREHRPDLSPALDALLARCLAKAPSQRPPDGRALAREIDQLTDEGHAPSSVTATPSLGAGEARFVTVVVAAPPPLAGSSLSQVETVLLQRRTPVALEELAERFGAHLERLADGVVVAAMQVESSATDQATRAARFALALAGHWPGLVAMSSGRAEWVGQLPVGAAIDRAMALAQARSREPARPGTVRIDEVTASLLDLRFDVGGAAPIFVLVGERATPAQARTLLGRELPCVGRSAELAALQGLCARSAEESVAQAILLVGSAGVGKSRVRYELVRALVDTEVWVARTDPLSQGSAYGVVAELVRRAVGMAVGDAPDTRWNALQARLARRLPAREVDRVATFLGEVSSTPRPGQPSVELAAARSDPALLRDQIERAFQDWLRAECRVHPVLIVLEDLHWGDAPSVALLGEALRELADHPLCVLGVARPEIREVFPNLWADRPVQEVRLAELSKRAAERLVREALRDRPVTDELVARLVERSAGNAFYLEELCRAVAEGRDGALPESVVAMAAARLDTLDAEDRRVLRAASVFGGSCWRGGLVTLLGGAENTGQIHGRLAGLAQRELLTPRRESRYAGEPEYTFRHALVREAAYASLTDGDRALGHRLAASWLTSVGETDDRVLAEHWERGGEREKAAEQWRRAARAALLAGDFAAAVERAERGARGGAIGEMRLVQAEAHRWLGEFAEASRRADEALSALSRGSRAWIRAAAERAEVAVHLGDHRVSVDLGEELCTVPTRDLDVGQGARIVALLLHDGKMILADRLIERLDVAHASNAAQPGDEALLELAKSYRAMYRGDVADSLAHDRRVVEAFRRMGDEKQVLRYTNSVAYDCVEMGLYDEALSLLTDAIPRAEALRLGTTPSIMRQNLALALHRMGRLEEAVELQRRALAELDAKGDVRFSAASRMYLAMALYDLGRLEEALASATGSADEMSYSETAQVTAFAVVSDCLLGLGRTAEAPAWSGRAYEFLVRGGAVEEGEARVRLSWARALAATGRLDEARAVLATAQERLRTRAAAVEDPTLRAAFLAVPDHAATLATTLPDPPPPR